MKVAVIGGGSTYTPELVNGFLTRLDSFPLNELSLMDIDPERLSIVGGFAQRMVAAVTVAAPVSPVPLYSNSLQTWGSPGTLQFNGSTSLISDPPRVDAKIVPSGIK